jgi:hypothetical protein
LRQPAFLELRNKFTIYASDLHGDSGATGRLFEYFLRTLESGKDSQIVILGDLDEGINMFQVYLLIAELHVLFPGRIFLTMGNHEIEPKFGFVYSYEKLNKTGDAYGKYAGYIYGEWAQSLPLAVKVGEHTVACHGFWHHNLDSIEKLNGLEKTKAFENGSSENYMLFSDPFDTFDEDRIFEIRNLTDEARIYPITGRLKIGSLLFANTLRKIFPKVNAYISGHLHSMSSQRQMFKVGDSDFGIYKTSINGLAKEGPNAGNRIDIQPNFFCFLVQENPDSEPNDIYRVNIDTLETYRYS